MQQTQHDITINVINLLILTVQNWYQKQKPDDIHLYVDVEQHLPLMTSECSREQNVEVILVTEKNTKKQIEMLKLLISVKKQAIHAKIDLLQ